MYVYLNVFYIFVYKVKWNKYMYMTIYLSICKYINIYGCVYVYKCIYIYIWMCVYVYICECMYIYIYIYIYMNVCIQAKIESKQKER